MGKLFTFADHLGLRVKVQEWNRDLATQRRYVEMGVSKTLNSKHLDNCATDIYIVLNGAVATDNNMYRPLGEYWESLGGRWGGRFVDMAAFKAKNNRDFDPKIDIGWDPVHFESADV